MRTQVTVVTGFETDYGLALAKSFQDSKKGLNIKVFSDLDLTKLSPKLDADWVVLSVKPTVDLEIWLDEFDEYCSGTYQINSIVLVVDAQTLQEDLFEPKQMRHRVKGWDEQDPLNTAEFICDRLDFAQAVAVLGNEKEPTDEIEVLGLIQPNAKVLLLDANNQSTIQAKAAELFQTGAFQEQQSYSSSGTTGDIKKTKWARTTFDARAPFHPVRLWDTFDSEEWTALFRSVGVFWLATRNDEILFWSQIGASSRLEVLGNWLASIPKEEWELSQDDAKQIQEKWDDRFGDRFQSLTLIVPVGLQERAIQLLNEALLTEEELKFGKTYWINATDPFEQVIEESESAEGDDHDHDGHGGHGGHDHGNGHGSGKHRH